jgi:hypothetical protein
LLRCMIFIGRMSQMGQKPPPSIATGMDELARRPDASVANRWSASGYRSRPLHTGDGCSPETGRRGRRRLSPLWVDSGHYAPFRRTEKSVYGSGTYRNPKGLKRAARVPSAGASFRIC